MKLDDYRNLIPVSAEDEKKLTPIFELFKNYKYSNVEIVYEKCKWAEREYVHKPMTSMKLKKLGEELYKAWIENEKKI